MKKLHHTYEIRFLGHLDPNRFQLFEDQSVTHLPNGETVLIVTGLDQAKLFGILIRIRDMGIPLLSLNRKDLNNETKRTLERYVEPHENINQNQTDE